MSDFLWVAVRAVMCIVQEHSEAELLFQIEDRIDNLRMIPLVDYHYIASSQCAFRKTWECEIVPIEPDVEIIKLVPELLNGVGTALIFLGQKVTGRPRTHLLVTADVLSKSNEFGGESPQEVRVAVVPVGNPRMGKEEAQ